MKAVDTNILNLIGGLDKVFIIPPFQRNYNWEFEQCEELFNDIINSFETKKPHYLGNIVYYIGENNSASLHELILVDGQQRITSILLLLCAIRDYSKEEDILKINTRYLLNDTNIEKFRIKLKQTSYDFDNFSSIIENKNLESVDKNSNIIKNYNYFLTLIENTVKTKNITPEDIYNSIEKLEVVDVNLNITNDLKMVQTVFEKINHTGKGLEQSDLIRNYLLLSTSSDTQEELYENYWVILERQLGNNYISKFAKYYLITKIFEDVKNDNTYKSFKEYFDNNKTPHTEILTDMLKYSKYFSWINNENCPDEELNITLKILNLLKTDDLYPLYIVLFEKLYENDKNKLNEIMNLLSDFMIRYRIVSPSGGGGALRTAIYSLIEKIIGEIITLDYDSILFELSNSSTPANRFPTDDEFKEKLMEAVNSPYARALLYKMEKVEYHNIPVELNKITIEHLLPQTRNQWWTKYLGGEKRAEEIYDKYLDCIGNLALISGSYNSRNSNKPWPDKRKNLKNVQFNFTSVVANNKDWKEEEITSRNEYIATKACKDIIGPVKRTREYESKDSYLDFESGIYSLADIVTPMSGTKIKKIMYDDKEYEITKWCELLPMICEILYEIDSKTIIETIVDNTIHKATSKYIHNAKDPILSFSKDNLVTAIKLKNNNIYVEGCLSSDRARHYTKQLLDLYGLAEYFKISVE